jgi:hypothetical protein
MKYPDTFFMLGITGFLGLYIARYSRKLENITFRKLDLFPSSGKEREAPTQLEPLEEIPSDPTK